MGASLATALTNGSYPVLQRFDIGLESIGFWRIETLMLPIRTGAREEEAQPGTPTDAQKGHVCRAHRRPEGARVSRLQPTDKTPA
jgi:hypothetical protein